MRKWTSVLISLLLIPNLCFADPISHCKEETDNGNGTITQTILAYPKYYKNEQEELVEVDTSIVECLDVGWDWEVKTGVFQLRIQNDGTFEVNHLGDIFQQKLLGLGFFNTDTKEKRVKTNLTLSDPVVSGNTISWTLPLGCTYELRYINDCFKDVLVLSQQAKNYFKTNKPDGWTADNTWIGLIYDMDLSQSTLIESKDFETEGDVTFKKNGRVKHKIRRKLVTHKNYDELAEDEADNTDRRWYKKKIYKNGKYVEAIPVRALESEDGELIFNTDVTFQEGIDAYTGCLDTYIYYGSATTDYSSSTVVRSGAQYTNGTWKFVTLILFDVSSISSSATVSVATLSLAWYTPQMNANGAVIGARRVLKPWEHGDVTYNRWDHSASKEWGTVGAWNRSDAGTENEGDGSGYDIYSTPDGTATFGAWVNPAIPYIWKDWDVSTACQNWVDGTWSNYGVHILNNYSSDTIGLIPVFYSSDYTTNTDRRPKLAITYTDEGGAAEFGQVIMCY